MMEDGAGTVIEAWGPLGVVLVFAVWALINRTRKVDELQDQRVEENKVVVEAINANTAVLDNIAEGQDKLVNAVADRTTELVQHRRE